MAALSLVVAARVARAEGGPGDLWNTFTTNDGLGSGNVAAVFKAQDGALWFGTDAGASRYNGNWQSFTERDGLPAGRVRVMAQTGDGLLWFGTQLGGVGRCAANGSDCARPWTMAQGLPDNDVRALLPAHNGSGLWVGTAKGVAFLDGRPQVGVTPEKDLEGVEIWALKLDAEGAVLAGTAGKGVWRRGSDGVWRALGAAGAPTGVVYALHADRTGRVWAGTDEGLFIYQGAGWRMQSLAEGVEQVQVFAIAQDRTNRLWVGTDDGLFYSRDARTPDGLEGWLGSQSGGLVNEYIRALAFADDGSLWLGTLAGVSRYDEATWQVIQDEPVLGQRINTIIMDHEGRTWAGAEYNGLLLWDRQAWQRVAAAKNLPDSRVTTLYEDSKGRLWFGTGSGVGFLESTGKLTSYGIASGIAGLPVYAIAQDAANAVVLATQGGVSRYDEKGGFQPIADLAGKRVNAIHRTSDGTLWFGAEQDGLLRLTNEQLTQVTLPSGAPFRGIVVNGIVSSPEGELWVATYDDGLWRYAPRNGQWQRVDAPLPTPRILTLRYLENNLWVATRQGFARFDGRTWQSYSGDALPSPETLVIAPGPSGSIWVGTANGIVRYTPEKKEPWVRIESVNLSRPVDGRIRLTSDTLTQMQLRGGDLATRPEGVRFLTQLDGVDKDPQAHLTSQVMLGERRLAPGAYRLRAWARDDALNYSPPVEVTIIVPPLVRLPGGYTVPRDTLIAMAALGLVAIGGLASAGGIGLRTRREARARAAAEAARRREALERHFNPYISGEPVRQASMFFGRDALLRKIVNALHQNSIMIHGERRMGKTTLLYQLGQALRAADDPEWIFIPVSVDLEGTSEERLFYLLMDAIWGMLQAYLTEAPPKLQFTDDRRSERRHDPHNYSDREFTADLRAIIEAVKPIVAPRQMRIILLIDEMDAIDGYSRLSQLQLRRVFMSPLAENLGAVVAGVQISKAWDRLESPWYNLFYEFPLEPFDAAQARQLLIEPVYGIYEWAPDAIEFVIAHSDGRPYRLQQYALEAVNQMLSAGRTHITLADVQTADVVVEQMRPPKEHNA
jgi:ligand-binding sensor domain-containing protein